VNRLPAATVWRVVVEREVVVGAKGSGRAPLVEIVPNFSEGRRQGVIDAILEACRVPGVRMLTWQADPDHNRLDASLVGSAEAVRRCAAPCGGGRPVS